MTVVASNYARVENDLYQTEPWATEAFTRFFPVMGRRVWCAAAGNHLMADVLIEHGADVMTSDLKTYDREHDFEFDFLKDYPANVPLPGDGEDFDIIENPPYGLQNKDAARFARLALKRCAGTVALLLTAKFDSGKTRLDLLANNPRFTAKIVLIDRVQWFPGTDMVGTEDHAWFVWTARRPTRDPALLYAERLPPRPHDLFAPLHPWDMVR